MPRALPICALALLCAALVGGCGKRDETGAPVEPPDAGDRRLATQRLREIGTAMHRYHDTEGGLPTNRPGTHGRPALSWRVVILPHFADAATAELFRKFKLDEAWDSEHNKKLIPKMPDVFASPGKDSTAGMTHLRSFTGGAAVMPIVKEPSGRGRFLLAHIPDGPSYTLMVAEAGEPVEWTRPDDLPFPDASAPLPKLGGVFRDGFHGLMCDGGVYFFPASLSEPSVRALITIAGNDRPGKDAENVIHKPDPEQPFGTPGHPATRR
ncbi:MAG: DUF1559 domain-containing protein [Planctomycetes bacterium]|nr:DUF1559 domain-containing protein [Planctomycetota bacterium]